MTELYAILGGYVGWRAQRHTGYDVSATLDGQDWRAGPYATIAAAERAFYGAAHRAFWRKALRRVGIRIAPPQDAWTPS